MIFMEENKLEKEILTGQTKNSEILQENIKIPLYEKIIDDLNIGHNVSLLDIGCGSGMFCQLAFSKGANVTGIDFDANLINVAKSRVPSEKFILGDLNSLPFSENSFGIISFIQSLSFAKKPITILQEAKRVLQLDGFLVIATWGMDENGELPRYIQTIKKFLPEDKIENNHLVLSGFDVLESLLKEAGFVTIKSENFSSVSVYKDPEETMNTILASAIAQDAINHADYSKVYNAVYNNILPHKQQDNSFRIEDKFKIVYANQK